MTDATIKELTCPPGRKDALFFDDTIKGFGIRVMPNRKDGKHRKVFLLQYRVGAKVRREPIGDWGSEMTATQARRRAEALRGMVRGGNDPTGDRKALVASRKAEAAQAKVVAEADAFTFEKLVQAWDQRSLVSRRPSYRKEAVARVKQGLAEWLAKPAASITRTDAAKALQQIAAERGPVGANRIMAYARACYGWAIKANLQEVNPFAGLAPPGRERARDRVLSDAEIVAIWIASEFLEKPHRAFVRFLMLTLQRRDEVAGAVWAEFSEDLTTWMIPAERAKNDRAHLVHLTAAAREVLKLVPRSKRHPLVFALPGGKKLTAFSAIKRTLDAEIAKAEAEAAAQQRRPVASTPGWTFHDFRRTGVTALAGMGIAPHVCDRLLNHVSGSIQGVAAVYQRAEFLAERKAALEAWAEQVVLLADGEIK